MSVPISSPLLYNTTDYNEKDIAAFQAMAKVYQNENENSSEELLPTDVPRVFYTKDQLETFEALGTGKLLSKKTNKPESPLRNPNKSETKAHKVAEKKLYEGKMRTSKERTCLRTSTRFAKINEDLSDEMLPPGVPRTFYTWKQLNKFEKTARALLQIKKGTVSRVVESAQTANKIAEIAPKLLPASQPKDKEQRARANSLGTAPVEQRARANSLGTAPVEQKARANSLGTAPVEQKARANSLEAAPIEQRDEGTIQAILNPRDDNPTATKKSTSFEVKFGNVTKKLGYSLRHNSESAGIKPTDLAQLSGQTRLLIQQTYQFYKDQLGTTEEVNADLFPLLNGIEETDASAFRLNVLKHMTSYNIRFNSDKKSVSIEVHDSKNRAFTHEFVGTIPGNAQIGGFEVEAYLNDSQYFVETALEGDKEFANNSGRTFFLRYLEAGGTCPRENTKSELSSELSAENHNRLLEQSKAEADRRQNEMMLRRDQEVRNLQNPALTPVKI